MIQPTEKKRYRESYISGDISWSDLDSSMTTTSHSEMSTTKVDQRMSVISNVSSVATSGIVSDERSPVEKTMSEGQNPLLLLLQGNVKKGSLRDEN